MQQTKPKQFGEQSPAYRWSHPVPKAPKYHRVEGRDRNSARPQTERNNIMNSKCVDAANQAKAIRRTVTSLSLEPPRPKGSQIPSLSYAKLHPPPPNSQSSPVKTFFSECEDYARQ